MSLWSAVTNWLIGPYAEPRQALTGYLPSYVESWDTLYYDGAGTPDVHQTAAVEIALGIIGRSFLSAEITGIALDPLTLSMIARQTMGLGNAVFVIGVSRTGDIRLMPVAAYDVIGEAQPGLVALPRAPAAPQHGESRPH